MLNFNATNLNFLFSALTFFSRNEYVVDTLYGKLEGTVDYSRNGREFYQFSGIPYARPPTNERRFQPPEYPERWEGIRDATEFGARCVQYHLIAGYSKGTEDCLFLNVFTHKFRRQNEEEIPQEQLNPVIMYLHGGLFMYGHSTFYKPTFFMDKDVVFVTVNYRVGSLGFLNLGTDKIRGNMGLKDQTMALKWIRDNIRYFGGDPNRVTLMGESAGGAAVHYHLLSPMSKGLFHRAISQSGNIFNQWALREHPVTQARRFAKRLNCSTDSIEEMTDCLMNMEPAAIAEAQKEAGDILHNRLSLFGPTVEINPSIDDLTFLPDRPEKVIRSGNISKVPWINGMNSNEGALYAGPMIKNETLRTHLNSNWSYWIPKLLGFEEEKNKTEIAELIRDFYFDETNNTICMDNFDNLSMCLTDRCFFEGFHNSLLLHGYQQPVYAYENAYRGEFSFTRVLIAMSYRMSRMADLALTASLNWLQTSLFSQDRRDYGTGHADELPLLFKLPFQKWKRKNTADRAMSEKLIHIWTTFARDGIPPELENGTIWEPVNVESDSITKDFRTNPIQVMEINSKMKMKEFSYTDRASFWQHLNLWPLKMQDIANADPPLISNSLDDA